MIRPFNKRSARRLLLALVVATACLSAIWGNVAPSEARAIVALPVMMYHYVSTPPADADPTLRVLAVTPAHFLAQMQWLKANGYTTVTPDALTDAMYNNKPLPKKSVLLTFDDGYADAYTTVFPILKQFGFVGTFFIVTDWIDANRAGYMNWSQIAEMAHAGMSIEAHSRTHQNMSGRTKDWLQNEIVGSMDAIEKHIGTRPRYFAYPSGRYDLNTLKAARAAGLTLAFTTRSGVYQWPSRSLMLPRIRMRGSTTVAEFAQEVGWGN
jgi:peptidoglycan/xylan/chitin deacetylase (PgdA/CDA1 family)